MSRIVDELVIRELYGSDTKQALIVLITITHDDLSTPIRVSSDAKSTTSRGDVYNSLPFQFRIPDSEQEAPPVINASVSNIDRSLVNALRTVKTPAKFLMEIVASSDLDEVIAQWPQFRLRRVQGSGTAISGELTLEDVAAEPYPGTIFSPSLFQGLFA